MVPIAKTFVKDKSRKIKEEEAHLDCCICLANFDKEAQVTELNCKHIFHTECLEKWMETKTICPFCREEVVKL